MPRLGSSLLSASASSPRRKSAARPDAAACSSRNPQDVDPSDVNETILIPLLAQRSYHLPGNSWTEDWVQWMRNNHIVFGIFFCHKLHPIEWWERILVLLGSMSFALIAINIYYILWVFNDVVYTNDDEGFDPQKEMFSLTLFGNTYLITQGTVVLWTFVGLLHSVWDFTVWQTAACACCHPGGRCYDRRGFCSQHCNDLGSYILVPFILGVMALAIYSSYLRTHSADAASVENDDVVDQVTGGSLGEFSFLVKYVVELCFAWFLFFPIFGTIMFSGILGCGKLPILGGRPRDKAIVEKELAEQHSNNRARFYASF